MPLPTFKNARKYDAGGGIGSASSSPKIGYDPSNGYFYLPSTYVNGLNSSQSSVLSPFSVNGGSESPNGGWYIPPASYGDVYNSIGENHNVSPSSGLWVSPSTVNSSTFSGSPPAAATTPTGAASTIAPNYSQFTQQLNDLYGPSGGALYSGNSDVKGLGASDNAQLKSLYAPIDKPDHALTLAHGGIAGSRIGYKAPHQYHAHGLFAGSDGGRTDTLKSVVPGGAYVIPADVVSGIGEGSTLAGSKFLDQTFNHKTGPYGMSLQKSASHPVKLTERVKSPSSFKPMKFKDGGNVPIIAAGGEYLVHPEVIKKLGKGDIKHGHRILDAFVKHVRNKTIKTLKKLPSPKR